jgi:hypothetical protein
VRRSPKIQTLQRRSRTDIDQANKTASSRPADPHWKRGEVLANDELQAIAVSVATDFANMRRSIEFPIASSKEAHPIAALVPRPATGRILIGPGEH